MTSKKTTLNKLKINSTGIIDKLNNTGSIRRRMLDLGLVQGTKITPVFISPAGNPIAFEVRGTILSIRNEDSSLIEVTTNPN